MSSPKLIILVALVLLQLSTFTSALRSHNESCNKRKECDTTSGLKCLKGSCQCLNPDAQVFSPSLGTCVIKIGRRCGSDLEEDEENATAPNSNFNSTLTISQSYPSSCVENGECRKLKLRKWCRCKEGFMSNSEGTHCAPVSRYGESCSLNSEPCEKRSGTLCLNGRCQCPFGDHQYFDQVERKCISYANGNCSLPKVSPCVKNAECINVQLRTGYIGDDGVKKVYSKSVTQCHCVKGYEEDKGGFCMASHGNECGKVQPCNSEAFLACVDGKCKCRNPLHEMVDENTGKCVSLVGSSCNSESGLKCVENSECIQNSCQCKAGYLATSKKTCLLSYKESCEPYKCNSNGGLACINGLCECFDSHLVFDAEAKACVGLSSSSD